MADLSKLSDEELMGKLNSVSNLSDEELMGRLNLETPIQESSSSSSSSPASNILRLKMGLINDPTKKKKLLEENFSVVEQTPDGKFMVGDSLDDLSPLDPDGLFNDVLGDLADISGMILPAAAQVAGGMIGAAVPGVGPVLGGIAGAQIGEAAKIGLAKKLGVRDNNIVKDAVDIAAATAFGAAGEGLAKALSVGGKALIPKAGKVLNKITTEAPDPSKALTTVAKVLKTTSRVPEEDTITSGLYQFKNLEPKYMDKRYLTNGIMPDFAEGLSERHDTLGKAVQFGKTWAKDNFGNKSLEMRRASADLLEALKHPSIGMIDPVDRLDKSFFVENTDKNTFKKLANLFFKIREDGVIMPKNMKLSEYIDFKDRMRPGLKAYYKSNSVNSDVKRVLTQYFKQVDEIAKSATTQTGTITPEAIANNPYIKGMSEFSKWRDDLTMLKKNGLDITDVDELDNLKRDGKIISSQLETFMKNLTDKTSSARDAFKIVANQLPKKYKGGGVGGQLGTLYDELMKFDAAQGFNNANIDLMRFGMLTTLIGSNSILEGDLPKPLELGAALLVGTPSGARHLLRGGARLNKIASTVARNTIKARQVAPAGIAQLLQLAKTTQQQQHPE